MLVAALAAQSAKAPIYYPVPSAGTTTLPFSEAVQLGETLYVSGQIGNQPGTFTLVPGGIGAEAKQALDNMKAVLERHGASLDSVMKCTVFLADIKDWPAFNDVYRTYFKKNLPARSALAASGLAIGARVEVECIAFVPAKAN
jgi:reactive intermediate/imine deaminase